MSNSDICYMTATEMAQQTRAKQLSCREVVQAHLNRIDRINPIVNAIVTQIQAEQTLAAADAADQALNRGEVVGPLHGLPIAHKDLVPTKDLRTTWGSPIFKNFVPDHDGLIVQRLKTAGAITIGKTNTPEFGAGSQTYNQVFGETLNPYDMNKTCGGSSGGAVGDGHVADLDGVLHHGPLEFAQLTEIPGDHVEYGGLGFGEIPQGLRRRGIDG